MSRRGPTKQFKAIVEVSLTSRQLDYLDSVATLSGQPRAAVIRSFIDDRIDIAEGRYSPYPESMNERDKAVLRGTTP